MLQFQLINNRVFSLSCPGFSFALADHVNTDQLQEVISGTEGAQCHGDGFSISLAGDTVLFSIEFGEAPDNGPGPHTASMSLPLAECREALTQLLAAAGGQEISISEDQATRIAEDLFGPGYSDRDAVTEIFEALADCQFRNVDAILYTIRVATRRIAWVDEFPYLERDDSEQFMRGVVTQVLGL